MHPCVMNVFTLVEMNHTGGCAGKKEPGFFLNGLESVGVNPPVSTFISASLKEILCSAAVSERSESNSSRFNKKMRRPGSAPESHGNKALTAGEGRGGQSDQ